MKPLLTFLLGFGIASAIFLFVVMPRHGSAREGSGRRTAEVATKLELLQKIPQALGDDYAPFTDGYNPILEVKTEAIVVVERNGVKTLRRYHARARH